MGDCCHTSASRQLGLPVRLSGKLETRATVRSSDLGTNSAFSELLWSSNRKKRAVLRRLVVNLTLILSVVAMWLVFDQPNVAFAQNPTPAVSSSRTFIGPAPSSLDTKEPVGNSSMPATEQRAKVTPWSFVWRLATTYILLGGAIVLITLLRRSYTKPKSRKRGEPKFDQRHF